MRHNAVNAPRSPALQQLLLLLLLLLKVNPHTQAAGSAA
jgi:hypothetical protein